jgi:hypothetical protein
VVVRVKREKGWVKAGPALSGCCEDAPYPCACGVGGGRGMASGLRFRLSVSARLRDAPLTGYLPWSTLAFGGNVPGARLGRVPHARARPRLSLLPFLTREGNGAG